MKVFKLIDRTLLKFVVVGVINTLFGSAVMFAMYNLLGCSYWVSSAANYIFGSILSFFLNKHFTFQNQSKGIGVVLKFTVKYYSMLPSGLRDRKTGSAFFTGRKQSEGAG